MSIRVGDTFMDVRSRQIFAAVAMSVALFGVTTVAWPQQPHTQTPATTPQAAPPAEQPQAPPEPTARGNPGLVEEIGKLLKDTTSSLTPLCHLPSRRSTG